jgi:hypothetical protein
MILTAFNLTNGLSRLIMGYLSDKISRTGEYMAFWRPARHLLPRAGSESAVILRWRRSRFASTLFAARPLPTVSV